jgi:putative endonuclease
MKNLLRKLLGDRGERAAVKHLKKQGYRILAKQYRNQFGEIDIIAQIGATTIFVEVKTRKSADDGQPFEAVDRRKQEKLTRAALAWLKKHRRLEQPARFDIVSILWPDDGSEPRLTHYENAFEPTGRGQMFS